METITINGVTYTPTSDDAALTYDSSGNVTGISSGTVEITPENSTDPKITLDGSTPFEFTATAEDGNLRFSSNNYSFVYISGNVTYSASGVYFPAGEVSFKLTNATFSALVDTITVTIPSSGFELSFSGGEAFTISYSPEEITANLSGGLITGSMSLRGEFTYDPSSQQITLGEGATISTSNLSISGGTGFSFGITALAESTLALDGISLVIKDGASLNITGQAFGLSGDVSLSGGDLSIGLLGLITGGTSELTLSAGATITNTISGFIPFTITAPDTATAEITITDGVISITANDDNGINVAVGGLSGLPINVKGTIKIDNANQTITFTEGTVASITTGNSTIQVTANADATAVIGIDSDGSISLTPQENDGTLSVAIVNANGEKIVDAEIEVTKGSFSFNPSTYHVTVAGGSEVKVTVGDYTFTTSNSEDAGGTISVDSTTGGITFTPDTGDGNLVLTVEGTGDTQLSGIGIEALSGSFTLNTDGSISIAKDTEIKLDFSDTYSISFKTTDEAGGKIALVNNGISFTPGENDGHLELTVTNGDTTRTATLEMTGTVTYTLGGDIQLAEGTVVKNVFEDGKSLAITANTDASGTITFNPEGGLTIAPASANSFSITNVLDENLSITFDTIDGTFSYSGGIITASDGTSLTGQAYMSGRPITLFNIGFNTTGGESSLDCSTGGVIFIPREGATLHGNLSPSGIDSSWEFNINEGSMKIGFSNFPILTEGTVITANFPINKFSLETAGTYTLNGNKITTTEDGVEVSLTNYDTVSFDAGAAVAFEGFSFSGDGTVSITGNSLSLNEGLSLNKTFNDGTQLTVTANADATNAITYDSEGGVNIAPATADALNISIKDTNSVEVLNITSINGTLNYSNDDVLTFADGTELNITVYKEIPGKISSTGGTSTVKFESERATYTANDGATFSLALDNGESLTLQNGSVIDVYDSKYAVITAGTTLTSNISNETTASGVDLSFDKYILESAGSYNLNGNEITTTAANAEVSLTNSNTVSFDAGAGVTFDGNTFSGNGTVQIADGEISFVMTEAGSITYGGKTFTLTAAVSDGITIKPTDSGFEVSHVITAAEVSTANSALLGLTSADVGKTFTEKVTVSNDNSYTVELISTGVSSIKGISNNATVQASVTLDGATFANGTDFKVVTDSTGTITFGNKSYAITGDSNVVFGAVFNSSAATVVAVNSLSGGTVDGNFNNIAEINSNDVSISSGADDAQIAQSSGNVVIYDVASGSSVTLENEVYANVTDAMTVNDVNYVVTSDSDGVSINGYKNVGGLSANASLSIGTAGNYTVNNTALAVSEGDVIIGVNDNYAYIYDSGTPKFSNTDTTAEILDKLGVSADNTKIVSETVDSEQLVTLKNGGDIAIVEATSQSVTVTGGNGADTIVTKGENVTVDMRKGGADRITALAGNVTLENYHPNRNNAGIQLTPADYQKGMTFDDDKINLANATVDMDGNILNFYDLNNEKGKIGFAKSTDKVVDASSSKDDELLVAGGSYYTNEGISGATLLGGSGDNTIYGGANAYIAPGTGEDVVLLSEEGGSTLKYSGGNTSISGFNVVGGEVPADTIDTGSNAINDVEISNGAMILSTKKGDITIANAANKNIEINNNYTDGAVVMQVGNDALTYDGTASLFWAAGKNATVSFEAQETDETEETEVENVVLDLTNKDFNDTSKASFYGDIKEVNASNFNGTAQITGNDKNNVLVASKGGSTLNGGKGNNSLKGGDGEDLFISDGGNNTITSFTFGAGTEEDEAADTFDAGSSAINKVKANGNDLVLTADNGGTTRIANGVGQIMKFQSEHTNSAPILAQFDNTAVSVNDDANFYWAAGKNATVSLGEYTGETLGVDLTNSNFNDTSKLSFYGDIKEIDASGFNDEAELIGNDKNNVITASRGGSTLNGGGGNNSLVGGAGKDLFIAESGNTTISNFEFGIEENSDKLNSGAQAIRDVNVSGDNVILKTDDGLIRIADANNQVVQLQNEYTNNKTIYAQFGNKELELNEDANFYWAGGSNATVSVADYTGDSVNVDLSNADFNDTSKLSFYGDIRAIDATGYKRAAVLSGGANNNVITGGNIETTLWGGDGDYADTLIGGVGDDTFIYGKNNGNDVIRYADENDVVKFDSITLDDLTATGNNLFVGNDVKFELKDGGTLTVKDAKTSGVTFDVAGTKYAVNQESGEWEFK